MSNLPGSDDTAKGANSAAREIVFISKATPEDDEFVLWLAPRPEAAGYAVFADKLHALGARAVPFASTLRMLLEPIRSSRRDSVLGTRK